MILVFGHSSGIAPASPGGIDDPVRMDIDHPFWASYRICPGRGCPVAGLDSHSACTLDREDGCPGSPLMRIGDTMGRLRNIEVRQVDRGRKAPGRKVHGEVISLLDPPVPLAPPLVGAQWEDQTEAAVGIGHHPGEAGDRRTDQRDAMAD